MLADNRLCLFSVITALCLKNKERLQEITTFIPERCNCLPLIKFALSLSIAEDKL